MNGSVARFEKLNSAVFRAHRAACHTESDAELTAKLIPADYKERFEQVVLLTISAWDANCPQHIPQQFEAAVVAAALAKWISNLEREIRELKQRGDGRQGA